MKTFTLHHINDTHSHFQSQELDLNLAIDDDILSVKVLAGGYALLKSYVTGYSINETRFFFHAGDCFEGTLEFSYFKGKVNSCLASQLELDAMVIGNHEFDTGDDYLSDYISNINFPIICSNMELPTSGTPLNKHDTSSLICIGNKDETPPFRLVSKKGISIAVIGVTTDAMHDIAAPSPGLKFHDPVVTVERAVRRVRQVTSAPIVLLSHLGFERDVELAHAVPEIDFIIGGHSHTLLGDFTNLGIESSGPYPYQVGSTCILQAGCNSQFIGELIVHSDPLDKAFNVTGSNKLLIDIDSVSKLNNFSEKLTDDILLFLSNQTNVALVYEDQEIAGTLQNRFLPELTHYSEDELATSYKHILHTRIPSNGVGSELATLIAKAMLVYVSDQLNITADFAIINAGAVRAGLEPGVITSGDISGKVLPFSITLDVLTLKGKFLKNALFSSLVNAYSCSSKTGSYPYLYNLAIGYTLENSYPMNFGCKADKGHKETDLIDEQEYKIVTTSYLSKGKEGYQDLRTNRLERLETNVFLYDAFIGYLKKYGLS
ncbi:bifunctional metallophosphatase/5'-nucleotidase [Vibrio sp. S9_S30]|uniref:bifunctional metallophosphatase/5'-nucleotidase n=1 Tax=Vibrio sp. S9_S30 TaxID=2720226 RepID=UPI0016819BB2|nr:bifunctional UDP-sugar hydrolase/5'-nucleotidase [Vibrio sp. S9_S30]MBD1559763.1 bifunctional metallophosphatase/5'-nucleotidase [Vibrio sp. S9_S30]